MACRWAGISTVIVIVFLFCFVLMLIVVSTFFKPLYCYYCLFGFSLDVFDCPFYNHHFLVLLLHFLWFFSPVSVVVVVAAAVSASEFS